MGVRVLGWDVQIMEDAEDFAEGTEEEVEAVTTLAGQLEDCLIRFARRHEPELGLKHCVALAQSASCLLLASNCAKLTNGDEQAERFIALTAKHIRLSLPGVRRALNTAKANDVRFACRNPGTVN